MDERTSTGIRLITKVPDLEKGLGERQFYDEFHTYL